MSQRQLFCDYIIKKDCKAQVKIKYYLQQSKDKQRLGQLGETKNFLCKSPFAILKEF